MRKIIQSLNITPDGFCDHTNAIADAELHEQANELMRRADTVLFGRVIFELFENAWPPVAKERTAPRYMVDFADLMNDIHKIVFSRTLKHTEWQNTTIMPELNADAILNLKNKPGKDIVVGGISIMDQLSRFGLIDEYHFVVQPMLTGRGKRLFDELKLNNTINLELADSKTLKSGVIVLKYLKH